jgi:hypothetical protein
MLSAAAAAAAVAMSLLLLLLLLLQLLLLLLLLPGTAQAALCIACFHSATDDFEARFQGFMSRQIEHIVSTLTSMQSDTACQSADCRQ